MYYGIKVYNKFVKQQKWLKKVLSKCISDRFRTRSPIFTAYLIVLLRSWSPHIKHPYPPIPFRGRRMKGPNSIGASRNTRSSLANSKSIKERIALLTISNQLWVESKKFHRDIRKIEPKGNFLTWRSTLLIVLSIQPAILIRQNRIEKCLRSWIEARKRFKPN